MNTAQQRQLYVKLGLAIFEGNMEQVMQLIAGGVDVNTVDNGHTPLYLAINHGHINIARVLIEAGADINIANKQLFSAVEKDNTEKVRKLIAVGANVDIADKDGSTPLILAATYGRIKMVKTLINEGADVNITDKNGYTPLNWAVIQNHTEVIETLINEGADVNIMDKNGSTPLNWAVGISHISAIELIVNHIAKLEAASLHVSEKNLAKKNEFINTSDNRRSNYWEHLENCKGEVKKIEKENKLLHDFLKESNINKLASTWERNENICSVLSNKESLKKQYPEYAHILINKANEVKKEIFLHNNKPLIDFLSTHYRCDFQKMTLFGMESFFEVHKNDFKEERVGVRNNTLIYFIDLNVEERYAPKLKLQAFIETIENKGVNSNLNHPNTEQTQGASQSLN